MRSLYNVYLMNKVTKVYSLIVPNYLVFSPSSSTSSHAIYILQSWYHPYHTRVGYILGTHFCPIQLHPEPLTSSCKTT